MSKADTVTLSRAEYGALLDRIEELEDNLIASAVLATEAALGAAAARRDYLSADGFERILAGEHPLKAWREWRGLSQTALARRASLSKAYVNEIEAGAKPGSLRALRACSGLTRRDDRDHERGAGRERAEVEVRVVLDQEPHRDLEALARELPEGLPARERVRRRRRHLERVEELLLERAVVLEPTLLEDLGLHPRGVAVEYNGEILKRARYPDTRLGHGDRLEIVRFVQGGGGRAGSGLSFGDRAAIVPDGSGPLAQLVEQQTLNLRVRGSIPWRLTSPRDGGGGRRPRRSPVLITLVIPSPSV